MYNRSGVLSIRGAERHCALRDIRYNGGGAADGLRRFLENEEDTYAMKRLISALLAALLLFSLSACGEKEPDDLPAGYDDSLISELYSEEGEYTDGENNTLSYSYHVPQIVSETAVAAALNAEIADTFGALVQEQLDMMASRASLVCLSVSWESYWSDSLVCLVVRRVMDADCVSYAVYSYDFFGGKRLTSEELLARCGLSAQDFITAARRTAANYFDGTYRDALSSGTGGADFIASCAERRSRTRTSTRKCGSISKAARCT